ncbi:MAG TPA: hypothetical protein DEQ14_08445 [Treponema sp.]|nr:hypothetical protein [Treponema sp.]
MVAKAAALQKLIQSAVLKREWTDFETLLNRLNEVSAEMAVLEKDREALFAGFLPVPVELAGGDKGRFYTLCMRFTPEQRREIGEIYRSLKLEAIRVRLANEALLEYITEVRATMAGFFELAFPDRSGKIYTPRGTPVSHDMRSMVLNRRM